MFEWFWPVSAFVIPLPWLLVWLKQRRHLSAQASPPSEQAALQVPSLQTWQAVDGVLTDHPPKPREWLLIVAWLLLVVALMRPVWLGEPQATPSTGRNLVLLLDVSASMREADYTVSNQRVPRLVAVQVVADDFIKAREGDRIGLILFGDRPYVQAPLTFDHQAVRHFLSESVVGLAGSATAMGDAIGLGVKRLREREGEANVLILLSDGSNTRGSDPLEMAKLAAELQIKIHTIAVGSASDSGLFLSRRSAPPDYATMQQVAELTGGEAFRATDLDSLKAVYALIDELEPVDNDTLSTRVPQELFYLPFGLCLGLIGVWLFRQGRLA